ncbi:MAG: hypothetical protein NC483_05135 [Ruminococcus sp.]|nr:hypothetical protein [Ruminococcus sp.]
MELANILENKEQGKIYGLMGNITLTTNNSNYSLVEDFKFPGTVKNFLDSQKDISSLKMVMLNESYLAKTVTELSEIEIRKIILAKALIENKKYLALDYFEKGLSNKEKDNFKRLFKKLTRDYNKTIIIFTNDLSFLWDNADSIIYIDEKITAYSKEEYHKLLSLVDNPEISKFISLMRNLNLETEDYKNVLDLLKAIYRLKE